MELVRKKKALVVFPTFEGPPASAFKGFLEIAYVAGRSCPDWKFGWHVLSRKSLPTAMTEAAETVLQGGWDCLIAFDDDCFPPFDCIPRLIAHYEEGKSFVAGMGVMRNYPFTTTVARSFKEGYTLVVNGQTGGKVAGHEWLDDVSGLPDLADVDFCGVPVAIMARSIFERVEAPWFGLQAPDGGVVTHDVFLCRKLKAAGIPVLVDTTIKCGHLTEAPIITFENRTQARDLIEQRG